MRASSEAGRMRSEVLTDWGDELPGLPLNLFADELPAAYLRDRTGKGPGDFPVLSRCEVRAKIRRGCWAGALSCIRDFIDAAVSDPEDVGRWISHRLPNAFQREYDLDFHEQMLDLTTSLWDRMEGGTFTGPCCTAEEILIGIVLSDYGCRLESAELEPGIVDLDSRWLQDDDYLLLYNDEIAGSEDVLKALKEQLFTVNLDFPSWFKSFDN